MHWRQNLLQTTLFGGLLNCAALAYAQNSDVAKGQNTYETICAVCHGAKGEGGMGLPLKGIGDRMTSEQTVEKIKNPKDSMPKLFPAALSEQAVQDVAAFVRTLR